MWAAMPMSMTCTAILVHPHDVVKLEVRVGDFGAVQVIDGIDDLQHEACRVREGHAAAGRHRLAAGSIISS